MAPHGKELSEDVRNRIVALHKDGLGYKKIANTLKLSYSTVAKVIQRFSRTGSTRNMSRQGRPKKLSPRVQRHIQRLSLKKRHTSAASIAAEVEEAGGQPVSAQTIRRTLHQLGLHGRRPRKKPLLNLTFWMQELKTDKDDKFCRKVNEYLNNPPMPGALGGGADSGHELSALGGEGDLQSILGNMSHNQLMQLIEPTGLGRLGALAGPGLASLLGGSFPATSSSSSSSHSQSTVDTPSSSSAIPHVGSSQVPTALSTSSVTTGDSPITTPNTPAGQTASAGGSSPTQPIQLNDLQNILANTNIPAANQKVDLAGVLTPEIMAPILANSEVQQRFLLFLPSGEVLAQSTEELQSTLSSPQFQQAMSLFSSALASGQLAPLMHQFGLAAAHKGDVEAFAEAMESEAKSEQEEKPKDKKDDDDEDMSLD